MIFKGSDLNGKIILVIFLYLSPLAKVISENTSTWSIFKILMQIDMNKQKFNSLLISSLISLFEVLFLVKMIC